MNGAKETWVKRRGNLGGFDSVAKCNDPNGLSLYLMHIQSLESYRLDDLPAVGLTTTRSGPQRRGTKTNRSTFPRIGTATILLI
jgi:hypothetical protein